MMQRYANILKKSKKSEKSFRLLQEIEEGGGVEAGERH